MVRVIGLGLGLDPRVNFADSARQRHLMLIQQKLFCWISDRS